MSTSGVRTQSVGVCVKVVLLKYSALLYQQYWPPRYDSKLMIVLLPVNSIVF